MMQQIITDNHVQAAFDWLQEHSETAAKAKADRILAEHNVKKVKASVFKDAQGSNGLRDACADASELTQEAVNALAEAVRRDEWHRAHRAKAEAIIDAWRTEQSNFRAMGKVS
jgi:aspartate/methionine/tyrosine aminotransferase